MGISDLGVVELKLKFGGGEVYYKGVGLDRLESFN